jgi:hypothetical protein
MGWDYSAQWEVEKSVHSFTWQVCKVRDRSEDLVLYGRIILKWIVDKYVSGV